MNFWLLIPVVCMINLGGKASFVFILITQSMVLFTDTLLSNIKALAISLQSYFHKQLFPQLKRSNNKIASDSQTNATPIENIIPTINVWKKIYVNFADVLSKYTIVHYKVFNRTDNTNTQGKHFIYLDNSKLASG